MVRKGRIRLPLFSFAFRFRDIPVQHQISPKLQNPDSEPVRIGETIKSAHPFFDCSVDMK